METILNKRLIEQQGISNDDVAELEYLHDVRETLFRRAQNCDPTFAPDLQELQLYADLLESLEYNMQRVWKFPQDSAFHSWWYQLPHCKCPKLDNSDPIYRGRRIISGECPVHSGRS